MNGSIFNLVPVFFTASGRERFQPKPKDGFLNFQSSPQGSETEGRSFRRRRVPQFQAEKKPRILRGILQSSNVLLDDGQRQNNNADNQWNAGTFY